MARSLPGPRRPRFITRTLILGSRRRNPHYYLNSAFIETFCQTPNRFIYLSYIQMLMHRHVLAVLLTCCIWTNVLWYLRGKFDFKLQKKRKCFKSSQSRSFLFCWCLYSPCNCKGTLAMLFVLSASNNLKKELTAVAIGRGRAPRVQILSFSCSFLPKICKIIG